MTDEEKEKRRENVLEESACGEKSRALIKNREREIKTQTVTQKRWKEKHDKIKPRRQLGPL